MRTAIAAAAFWIAAMGSAAADGLELALAGIEAFRGGRIEEAVEIFSQALGTGELGPADRALTLNNRGVAWNELGDFDRAIGDLEAVLEARPGDAEVRGNLEIALINRGDAARMLGEPERASADYSRAIVTVPDSGRAHGRRALLRFEAGDHAGARADLAIALTLDPTSEGMRVLASRLGGVPAESASDP